ncbi:MAG: fibronectin type III domain-containing protein [Spirochaetia bacterium]|nr:fibronectin type III domain-containing protein [Spirochaetia bacterium]
MCRLNMKKGFKFFLKRFFDFYILIILSISVNQCNMFKYEELPRREDHIPGKDLPSSVDTNAPSTPASLLAAAAGPNQINLSWEESTDDKSAQANLLYEICFDTETTGCDTFTADQTTAEGVSSFTVGGLEPLTLYYFTIRAKDKAGNISLPSDQASAQTSEIDTLNSPTFDPAASLYAASQNVAINADEAASICYMLGTAPTTEPACDSSAVCPTGWTLYSAQVTISATNTLNAFACMIGYKDSAVSSGTYTIDSTSPAAPSSLNATSGGTTQINLSWVESTDNNSAQTNLVYEICYGLTATACDVFSVDKTTSAGAASDSIAGLNPNTMYYFTIRAKDEAGNIGPVSNQASVSTDAVGILSAPSFNPIADLYTTAQDVTILADAGANICYKITDTPGTPACDTSAACPATWTQYLTQVNIATTSTLNAFACRVGYTDSIVTSGLYTIDTTAPTAPSGLLAVSAGTTQIDLSWTQSTDPGGSAPANLVYEICYGINSTDCDTFTVQDTITGAGLTTITLLSPNTTYYFTVRAKDEAGNVGPVSNQDSVSTDAVGILSAPSFNPIADLYTTAQDVTILADAGANICYKITDTPGTPACDTSAACPATWTQYLTQVNIATTSTLNAFACRVGYTDSIVTSGLYTIDTTAPTAPSGLLAVSAGTTQIDLSWTQSTDPGGSAPANLVYEICYGINSTDCDTFTVQDTITGAGSTTITLLSPNTTYYFTVRAKDEAGNVGPVSNQDFTTTDPLGTVSTPTFGTPPGTYAASQDVSISSDAGATICYKITDTPGSPACDVSAACPTGWSTYDSATPTPVTISTPDTALQLNAFACRVGYLDSSLLSGMYTIDQTPPGEVTGLAAAIGDNWVDLSWSTEPTGDADFDHLEVSWSSGCTTAQIVAIGVKAYKVILDDTCAANGLAADTTYTFTVQTVDTLGNISTGVTVNNVTTPPAAGFKKMYTLNGKTFNMVYVPGKTVPLGVDETGDPIGTGAIFAPSPATVENVYIGETEVTYELWSAVYTWATVGDGAPVDIGEGLYSIANSGVQGAGGGTTVQHPATSMSWRDAIVWTNALTEYYNAYKDAADPVFDCVYTTDGTTPIRTSTNIGYVNPPVPPLGTQDNPNINTAAKGFRLPIRTEWELAARYKVDSNFNDILDDNTEYYPGNFASGSTVPYFDATAATENALVAVCGATGTAAVGSKTANALGIFDMSGNVHEMNPGPGLVDPTIWIYRGGTYSTACNNSGGQKEIQLGYLLEASPDLFADILGFRIAKNP